ncbi:hypothetical protein ISF_06080 [Cordyceps fumosorosea ARSEF 2679]|uniref:Uncharacterized protein n=1 Tax=Cordyceps fumosorosea (strain ARSEF 2679) TaxID=1081104 RepID=A0A167SYQ2_CORFA|nr:hypothetical protein ISF_06080 [Cordyceps fumosorosea ARSEF 2679]OAA60069.1 hypothetical protein ISF_06080 [Cordyceps fumosorosea ARSEF 2679]
MIDSQRTEIRCQLCGVSGNVGRVRLATEPPEAASRRLCQGRPVLNESGCIGCFVVTDDGAEDALDAADTSFVPEDLEDMKAANEVLFSDQSDDDMSSDDDAEVEEEEEEDDDASFVHVGDDSVMEMETETGATTTTSHAQFPLGSPSDICNIIVPFDKAYRKRDRTWRTREHVAGPNCRLRNAYAGRNITADELRGCNTMQLLCPKPADWTPEPADDGDDLDGTCPSFLSGLRDHLHPNSTVTPVFVPMRHGRETFAVYNRPGARETDGSAMPLHPACFEVFKRASLKRSGAVDVHGLAGWYSQAGRSKGHFADEGFPQGDAVRRALPSSGQWDHVEGDEWIAANPCFVPALRQALAATATPGVVVDGIADMTLSSAAATDHPQSFHLDRIREEMPWIWESWCYRPYSGWSAVTQSDICADPLAASYQREYLRNSLAVARQASEGREQLSEEMRAELWRLEEALEAFEAENRFVPVPIPATLLPQHGTDWRKLYAALQGLRETSKGLRNRERVWRCCNYILDRIAEQRENGKIVAYSSSGALSESHSKKGLTGTSTYHVRGLDLADDYSEGEAEFSDNYSDSDAELSDKADDVEMDASQ